MADRHYKAYSYVKNYKKLGEVCVEWVYNSRRSPVAHYREVIYAYDDLTERDRRYACRRADEMFTGQEVTILSRHLESVRKVEYFTVEKPLPIHMGDFVGYINLITIH